MVQKTFEEVQSQTSSVVSVGCALFIPEDGDWSIHFGSMCRHRKQYSSLCSREYRVFHMVANCHRSLHIS